MSNEEKILRQAQDERGEEEHESQKQMGCKQCEVLNENYLHLAADYQNYQKRTEKDRSLWIGQAQQGLLLHVIKIIDDFDRALAQHTAQEQSEQFDAWLQGFELIGKSLNKLLDQYGVKKIDDYSQFNPELHEAVANVDSPDHKTGEIVTVYEPGYMVGDKVLRPAKVTVAK